MTSLPLVGFGESGTGTASSWRLPATTTCTSGSPPMDHRGNVVKDGIRSFIVGTGGKSLHSLGTVAKGSRVRFTEDFGILLLTLRPGSYDWRFRTIGGVTVDTGTGVCH